MIATYLLVMFIFYIMFLNIDMEAMANRQHMVDMMIYL